MSKRSEEKAKLAANFMNGLALLVLNLGVFAPLFAYIFNLADFRSKTTLAYLTVMVFIDSVIGVWLHKQATKQLDKLSDD